MTEQNDLIRQILKAFNQAGILNKIAIIGSWCIHFYRHHYKEAEILSAFRTRDIDIDVNSLQRMKNGVNIPDLLDPIGFRRTYHGNNSLRLEHQELTIDFMIPETGRGSDDNIRIPTFGITAIPLRFLDILEREIITIDYHRLPVRVPHPVWFALHKLIISQRRANVTRITEADMRKPAKDILQGVEVLEMVSRMGEGPKAVEAFNGLTKKQKGYIRAALVGEMYERMGDAGILFE